MFACESNSVRETIISTSVIMDVSLSSSTDYIMWGKILSGTRAISNCDPESPIPGSQFLLESSPVRDMADDSTPSQLSFLTFFKMDLRVTEPVVDLFPDSALVDATVFEVFGGVELMMDMM